MSETWFEKHIWGSSDSKPKAGVAPPTIQQPMVNVGSGVQVPVSMGQPAPVGVDSNMVADIQKIIRQRPSPFTALEDSANAMSDAIPDELTRVKGAFSLLKRNGTQAVQVIGAIDLHIRDIEAEKVNFQTGAQQAVQKKAGALRAEAQQLLQQNTADGETVKNLELQIQNIRSQINEREFNAVQKQNEASKAEADINNKVSQFTTAADSVISSLNMKKTQLSSMLS